MSRYVIEGGAGGKARLSLLSRVLRPTTNGLLDELAVSPGWRCLDVGCGGGDVTQELGRRVGPTGRVVGIDRDGEILALARKDMEAAGLEHVELHEGEAGAVGKDPTYDLVYARFLLTHVPDPAAVQASMREAARPNGIVSVEDIDFSGHFCHPPAPAFASYVELYREVVRRRGGDADIGPRLPGMFVAAGLQQVRVRVVQPAGLDGELKAIAAVTMEKIADAVVAERLASREEVAAVVGELKALADDSRALMSLPRIFQVWGRA